MIYKKIIGFILTFSWTCPLGMLIGILTSSSTENDYQVYILGIANSLAAGSLLYISLTEMTASYFNTPDLPDKPYLKLFMASFLALGVAATALLAIWA